MRPYKRKEIKNFRDLRKEKKRIHALHEELVEDINDSFFSPKALFSFAFALMANRKRRQRNKKKGYTVQDCRLATNDKFIRETSKKPKGFLKRSLRLWLRWQLLLSVLLLTKRLTTTARRNKSSC